MMPIPLNFEPGAEGPTAAEVFIIKVLSRPWADRKGPPKGFCGSSFVRGGGLFVDPYFRAELLAEQFLKNLK